MSCIWTFSFPGNLIKRGSSRRTRSSNAPAATGPGQWVSPPEPHNPPLMLQPQFPPVQFSKTVGPLRIEGEVCPTTHRLVAFQIRFVPQQFPSDPAYANPIYSLAQAVPILGAHPAPHHMTFRSSHVVTITHQQPFAASGEVAVGAIQCPDRWGRWNEVVAISYDVEVWEPRVQWNGATTLYGPPQHLRDILPLPIPR